MRTAATYRAARRNAARKKAYVELRHLRKTYGYTRKGMGCPYLVRDLKMIEAGAYA